MVYRPRSNTSWDQAKFWTKTLTAGRGGWRMPTLPELKSLFQQGAGPYNMDPIFQTTAYWVWSGQKQNPSSAWFITFANGQKDWGFLGHAPNLRAFAVRSRR